MKNKLFIKVLLVGIDKSQCERIQTALKTDDRLEVELFEVESVESAIAHLTQQKFELILLDVSDSERGGIENVRRILDRNAFAGDRATRVTVPAIVALSDRQREDLGMEAIAAGALEYLLWEEISPTMVLRLLRLQRDRASIGDSAKQSQREKFAQKNEALVNLATSPQLKTGDFKAICHEIVEVATQTLEVERAGIWLYNDTKTAICCLDLYEKSQQRHSEGIELYAKDYPGYFKALASNRTIAAHDAHTDLATREFSAGYLTPLGINSMLDAPIRIGGEIVGVICCEQVGPAREWVLQEQQLAGSLADFVALGMEESERIKTNEKLRQYQEHLEELVCDRTAKLEATNQQLQREIEQRQKSAAALRESEEKYRSVVDNIHEAIFQTDGNGCLTFLNSAWTDITGYSLEESLGKQFIDFVAPEDRQSGLEEFHHLVLQDKKYSCYELKIITKTGENRWVKVCGNRRKTEKNTIGVYGTLDDISDRKQVEAALRESEERFRAIVEGTTVPLLITRAADGTILYGNQLLGELLGIPLDRAIGQPTPNFYCNPSDRSLLLERVKQEGFLHGYELHIKKADGTPFWVVVSIQFITYNGEPALLSSLYNITTRKHAEEAVKESERQYRYLVETSQDLIWSLDSDGCWTFLNPVAEQLYGYSLDEMLGHHFSEFQTPERAQQDSQLFRRLLAGASCTQYETEHRRKDGTPIYLSFNAVPLRDDRGNILGTTGTATDITDRLRAELEQRMANERLQYLLSSSPAVIYSIQSHPPYAVTFMSANVRVLLGYDAQEFMSNPTLWRSALHPEDCDRVLDGISQTIEQGEYLTEYRFRHQNGEWHWMRGEQKLVRDEAGNPIEIVGYWADISDRKQAEAALNETSERLDSILQSIDDVLWSASVQTGQMLYINPAAEKIYGLPLSEFFDNPSRWMETIHPEDLEDTKTGLQRLFETGSKDVAYRIVRPDGEVRWVRDRARVIYDLTGNPVRIDGLATDITERKHYETALEQERQQLQQIVTHAPVAMAMFDSEMRYIAYSDRWSIECGLTGQAIVGRTHYELFPNIPERWRQIHQQGLQGQKMSSAEDIWEREDGSKSYIRWAIHPWYAADNAIGGIVMVSIAIDELVLAREQALETARLKSQFLANMSHEIRTPMNGVLGMTELLLKTDLSERQQEFVETLKVSGENLLTLINDILDFSKLEAGEMRLEAIEFDLKRLLEDAIDLFALPAVAKGLELALPIAPEVPQQICGDSTRLRQVLSNLLGNAIKFTETGEVTLEVRAFQDPFPDSSPLEGLGDQAPTDCDPGDLTNFLPSDGDPEGLGDQAPTDCDPGDRTDSLPPERSTIDLYSLTPSPPHSLTPSLPHSSPLTLYFAVKDTGIGISARDRNKLFQSFSQVDASTTRKYGGTGLGLAICKQLVQLMGGEIGVESKLGVGSTFWFTVPFERVSSTLPAEPDSDRGLPPDTSFSILTGKRLLVVDDRPTNRLVVRQQALHWGMQVTEASEGLEAIKILRKAVAEDNPYHLALLDMQMPKMDGEVLGELILSEPALAQTKLIMMTSIDESHTAKKLLDLGFVAYLIKPVKESRLFHCLIQALGNTSSYRLGRNAADYSEMAATGQMTSQLSPHLKILLVEDTRINQKVVLNQLEVLGLAADCVNNGQEALDKMLEKEYDLILMDCQMPVLDGYQATDRIRQREGETQHTIIIGLTAYAMKGDREKCLAAGMDDYLTKPVAIEDLERTIGQWTTQIAETSRTPDRLEFHRQNEPESGRAIEPEPQPFTPSSLTQHGQVLDPLPHPSPTEVPTPSPLDEKRLNEIVRDDREFATELLQAFVEDARTYLEQARQALAANDSASLSRKAHQIKGASATVAVLDIPRIAATLERQTKQNDLENASKHLEEIEKILERIESWIAQGQ